MTRMHRTDVLLLLAAMLLVWQGVFEYAGSVAITPPVATFVYAAGLLRGGFLWPHVWATMLAFMLALAISTVLGITLGLVFGLRRFAGDVAEPLIVGFYTIPKVTLYPVMLLLFGLGLSAKVAFGVIHGMVPILLFTLTAVKNLPPVYLRAARALRLSSGQTAMRVVLPALVPEIVSGLRVGFALTLLGVLIGEMFASQRGLGFLIINGINSNNVPMTTSVTLIIVVFAIVANSALLALDRWIRHADGGASQGTARS
jgi:NitT/TauT family transport system permease protein